ncbi:hypothetical protein C0995_000585, partial [Termitomyces sp. Mi166
EQAGYLDGLQLCLTFREGLHPTLMECIDNLVEGHLNNSIATWYKVAHDQWQLMELKSAAQLLPPGIPMEVNASCQHASTPLLCHCCKKPGHFARYCPQGLEVRYLSPSEQEELLLQLLAAKDASGDPSPDASLVDQSSEVSPAGPSTEQEEDF